LAVFPVMDYYYNMWTAILTGSFALIAELLFFRYPNPDSFILAGAGMMVVAIWSEELWEKFHGIKRDGHPRCPNCGYDTRATPKTCPECGIAIDHPSSMFPGRYGSVSDL
jgi:hypothetical protein